MNKLPKILILHHLSSSGGTLITKLMSTSENFLTLSELHPHFLSGGKKDGSEFRPSSPIEQLCFRYDLMPAKLLESKFNSDIRLIADYASSQGKILLVREWTHADYLSERPAKSSQVRRLIEDALGDEYSIQSIATVRDPVDSFLSGIESQFLQNIDNSFDKYCQVVKEFIKDMHRVNASIYRYEDIVQNPDSFLGILSKQYDICFPSDYISRLNQLNFSGDSGRKTEAIAFRPRRSSDLKRIARMQNEAYYQEIASQLGYLNP